VKKIKYSRTVESIIAIVILTFLLVVFLPLDLINIWAPLHGFPLAYGQRIFWEGPLFVTSNFIVDVIFWYILASNLVTLHEASKNSRNKVTRAEASMRFKALLIVIIIIVILF
jgi:hypothetical protein